MSKRKVEFDAAGASALATELHALSGKLKRRLREQASAGDLTPSQISVLPVIDPASRVCLGLLRLHDIYRAGTRLETN